MEHKFEIRISVIQITKSIRFAFLISEIFLNEYMHLLEHKTDQIGQVPISLTWINFNPSMYNQSHAP